MGQLATFFFNKTDDPLNALFEPAVRFLENILFWDPFQALGIKVGAGMPMVVVWLIIGGIYFTFRLKFINIRAFLHSIQLIRGKYDKPGSKGEVSHFQALTTALSATVGLGNIAGVAVAITLGGPGATFWMVVAGFLGMSLKFAECTLGLKYRKIDSSGEVSGGPMYYLYEALKKRNFSLLGRILAVIYAILIVFASFGGGNMLQSNQAYAQLVHLIPFFEGKGIWVGVFLAFLVGIVIIGGIKSIARVTEKIVPFMALFYVTIAIIIIAMNFHRVFDVFGLIIHEAFCPESIKGGMLGVLIIGFRRGAFSNEAGIGSASIAHSAARTNFPVREGIVALLEPFIDTVIVCTMTALVIIFTGFYDPVYQLDGAPLTSAAFGSVFPWFPYLLLLAIFLFAFSTLISWSYYGLKGFDFLFGKVSLKFFGSRKYSKTLYQLMFLFFTVLGSATNLYAVINFSDMLILSLAFPNLLGLIILNKEIKSDLQNYWNNFRKIKS